MKWGLTTTPGTICPDLCDKCVGSFTSHRVVWTVKGCETGSTVYSPYPKRLESLTICGCNYKGGAFSSVILRPWVLVWPNRVELTASRMATRCSIDWATGARCETVHTNTHRCAKNRTEKKNSRSYFSVYTVEHNLESHCYYIHFSSPERPLHIFSYKKTTLMRATTTFWKLNLYNHK